MIKRWAPFAFAVVGPGLLSAPLWLPEPLASYLIVGMLGVLGALGWALWLWAAWPGKRDEG